MGLPQQLVHPAPGSPSLTLFWLRDKQVVLVQRGTWRRNSSLDAQSGGSLEGRGSPHRSGPWGDGWHRGNTPVSSPADLSPASFPWDFLG